MLKLKLTPMPRVHTPLGRTGDMLSGLRVLIVEDEVLLAEDLSAIVTEAEGAVVGPSFTVADARALLKSGTSFDAAVLDVNLSDGTITPVLESLRARRIPTLVYTGGTLPVDVQRRHPDIVTLTKPVQPARLIAEIRRACRRLVA